MCNKYQVTGGNQLRCHSWRQEALLRLLENVMAVGENPDKLIVYAALGKSARDWKSYDAIVTTLKTMTEDYTLIVQSGKPIGLVKTHTEAPLVIMANCNIVGQWANAETFYLLESKGLICWGGLTAGDWQYIGSQGVIQGTYEIFREIASSRFNSDNLAGKFVLTAGLGGMGGAQPLAGVLAQAAILCVEIDPAKIQKRIDTKYLQHQTNNLDQALEMIQQAVAKKEAISVGLLGNAAEVYPELVRRGIIPDVVTDQTSAHDLVYGYIPHGLTLDQVHKLRKSDYQTLMNKSMESIVAHVSAMLEFQRQSAVVFDNGNLIRTHAFNGGVKDAFNIPVFTEAFLRPLFCRAIGPFRWIALSNDLRDIQTIDSYILEHFAHNKIVTNWIKLASKNIAFEGLPARIAWLGHKERTDLALAVNQMVASGKIKAPVAFTRDHLDAGAMVHPNIMTENLKDGSDMITDWPLLNGMINAASGADLVAIHSGGGGYSGYMTSAGVTIVADGTEQAANRIQLTITNDTTLGIMRYADAGYEEALDEAIKKKINYISLQT